MKLNCLCANVVVGVNKFYDAQDESGMLVEARLLTGNNINNIGLIDRVEYEAKTVFVEKSLVEKRKLKVGDVVFLSKGTNLRAAVVAADQEDMNLLAPATCLVISLDKSKILPEVLTVFINGEYGQALLESMSKGSVINHIPANAFKDIELDLPEMSKQKTLVNVFYKHNKALLALEGLKTQQLKTTEAAYQKLMR